MNSYLYVSVNQLAEEKISLLSNAAVLKAIANKYMMSCDKSEGANHEYYVTASYAGKIQGASQVNVDVANPDHQPKPKDDSAKFPATTDSKTKPQPDAKGTIKDAYFVNNKNQKLTSVLVNSHVKVQILSSNLIGKYIQYVVWEKDFGIHDEIFRSGKIKIPGDICTTGGFTITESHFQKGIDLPMSDPDSDKQNYFLEIIVLDSIAVSEKFGLDDTAPQQMEVVRSAAQVKSTANKKTDSTCICKEQYKDLIWGEMLSCDFRKKVVQISAELWGESRKMEMADGLMAVMNVETGGSFKAHQIMGRDLKNVNKITKDDFWLTKADGTKTSRAVGLIQFTQSALQTIGEFKAGTGFDKLHAVKLKFATMGEIKQLDYVKKYFMDARSKIKTPADIYLHVFAPSGVAKKDDYVLYVKGTEEYRQNKSVDLGSKGQYKKDGKIQRSEILERFDDSMKKGANNKPKKYSCKNIPENKSISKSESGFYIFRNGDIKFIASENSIKYFVQVKIDSSDFKEVGTLTKNSFGMVKFPDSGNGFGRYGGVDTGGNSKIENVGKGDHYLLPETAAALFGVTTEVRERNWEIHFGDMSSENGSDPTSSPEKASSHHAGHGHKGKQSGLNADFRYLNKTGKSFQGLSSSGSFDDSKNKELFNIAFKFGFNKNYATGKTYSGVNSKVGGHYDHGHFGTLSIKYQTVEKLDVKIIR